jgi:RNA polymerase sigma factor (sigma-70 family)
MEAEGNLFPHLEDEEVVKLYQQGKCSFTQVLMRYYRIILGQCNRQVPGYTSDEVYQELSIKMLKACKRWDEGRSIKFSTYLTYLLNQHIRKLIREELHYDNRRLNNQANDSIEELLGLEALDMDNPWTPWCEEEQKSLIEYLEGVPLTKREKVCVELVFEGYRKSEIAKILNLSRGMITKILQGLRSYFPRPSDLID